MRAPDRAERTSLPHIDEHVLLAYLDVELSDDERATVSAHLGHCWECRVRLAELEGQIVAFVRVWESTAPGQLPPAAPASSRLRAALSSQVVPADGMRSHLHHLACLVRTVAGDAARRYRRVPRAWRAAIATTVVAALLWSTWPASTMSATALLAEARAQESRAATADIISTSTDAERIDVATGQIDRIGTIETTVDRQNTAMAILVRPIVGDAIKQVGDGRSLPRPADAWLRLFGPSLRSFVEARGWIPEGSAAAFEQLIRDAGVVPVVLRDEQRWRIEQAFEPASTHGLFSAHLVLDGRTLQSQRLSLFFSEGGRHYEYRFKRTRISYEARTAEHARMFDPTPDKPSSARRPTVVPSPRRGPVHPLSYEHSMATTTEVAVAMALREVNADLGDELHVFPMSDGSTLVQGLLETSARKETVAAALQRIRPSVHVELFTPEDATARTRLYAPPIQMPAGELPGASTSEAAESGVVAGTAIDLGRAPMHERVEALVVRRLALAHPFQESPHRPVDREVAQFEAVTVQRSDAALFHAWALRRLDAQFNNRRASALPPSTLEDIDRLRRYHRIRAIEQLRQLRAEVLALAGEPLSAPTVADEHDDDLVALAHQQHRLVRVLFTAGNAVDPTAPFARLVTLLRRLG